MRPLLPGFLFVELHPGQWIEPDITDRWRQWYYNRQRALVSDEGLEKLREVERAGTFDEGPKRRTVELEIGSTASAEIVGITIEGAIERLGAADKAVFRGMMFNREVEITAPVRELHSVSA